MVRELKLSIIAKDRIIRKRDDTLKARSAVAENIMRLCANLKEHSGEASSQMPPPADGHLAANVDAGQVSATASGPERDRKGKYAAGK